MYFSKKKKKLSAQPKAYVSLKPCLEKPKPQGLLDGRLETSSPIRFSDYVDLNFEIQGVTFNVYAYGSHA